MTDLDAANARKQSRVDLNFDQKSDMRLNCGVLRGTMGNIRKMGFGCQYLFQHCEKISQITFDLAAAEAPIRLVASLAMRYIFSTSNNLYNWFLSDARI